MHMSNEMSFDALSVSATSQWLIVKITNPGTSFRELPIRGAVTGWIYGPLHCCSHVETKMTASKCLMLAMWSVFFISFTNSNSCGEEIQIACIQMVGWSRLKWAETQWTTSAVAILVSLPIWYRHSHLECQPVLILMHDQHDMKDTLFYYLFRILVFILDYKLCLLLCHINCLTDIGLISERNIRLGKSYIVTLKKTKVKKCERASRDKVWILT